MAGGQPHDPVAFDRTETIERTGAEGPTGTGSPPAASDDGSTLAIGDRGDDRYQLLAEHGRGGLGRVLRAHDRRLDRTVAVKELLRTSELAEAMFVREAMITARLEHPGIVPVHEAGRWPNGDPYYVMKMVSGRTLKEVLAGAHSLGERLALLPHLIAVAEAVGYAHSEQVVHRDLKPSNVLVGEFGETVVIDWGLARDLRRVDGADVVPPSASPASPGSSPAGPDPAGTVSGRVVGTPQYMSPEQGRGDPVGPAGDVYALGAMIYELLAGRPPIEGDSVHSLLEQLGAGPPRPLVAVSPGVPHDLEAIVAKAMARVPGDRYPSARELAADLKRFQTGQLVTAQRYGRWRLMRRWLVRYRGYVAMAAVATLALAALGLGMLRRVLDERRVAEDQRGLAERARAASEAGRHQLILAYARAALDDDPTTALAWLKRYPLTARDAGEIRMLVDEAEAGGVALQSWPGGDRRRGVLLTDDGAAVITGGRDGHVHVHDTATGGVRRIGDGRSPIIAVAAAASGHDVVAADADGRLLRLDRVTGASIELARLDRRVYEIQGLGDGRLLLKAPGAVLRRELDGALTDVLAGVPRDQRLVVAWDGAAAELLCGIGADGKLRRWHPGRAAEVVASVAGLPHELAVTADGRRAVAATSAGVHLIDLSTGAVRRLFDLPGEVFPITIDPTRRRAAVTAKTPDVHLIDLATGAYQILRGHTDAVYNAAFDATGDRMVTGSDDGTVRVWDLATGDVRVLRGHRDDVYKAAISADGRIVLSLSLDETLRAWRLDDRRTTVIGHLGDVRQLVSLGGGRLRALSHDEGVRIIDVDLARRTGAVVFARRDAIALRAGMARDGAGAFMMVGSSEVVVWHDGEATAIRLPQMPIKGDASSDGHLLITADQTGGIWRVDRRGAVQIATGDATIHGLAIAADGRSVLVVDRDRLRLHDVETGDLRAAFTRVELGISEVAVVMWLEGSSQVVITGNPDAGLGARLWNPADGSMIALDDSETAHGNMVASPDGRWVAGRIDEGRQIRLWAARTGATQATLRGHRDLVLDLAFSSDGLRLASASYDRTVRIWDLRSNESRVLAGHVGAVWDLAWLDDDHLVSGGSDGTIRAWQVSRLPPDTAELDRRLTALTRVEIDDVGPAMTPGSR